MTEREQLRQLEIRAHRAEERLAAVRSAIEAQAHWQGRRGAFPALMHHLLDVIDQDPRTGRREPMVPQTTETR